MTIAEAMQQAMTAHQAGDLARAEKMYRAVLAHQSNYPDALNLLGVLNFQNGSFAQAADLIGRAIDRAPATPSFHFNLGLVLAAQRQQDRAAAAFAKAVELQPTYAAAWSRMGDALYESNHPQKAAEACKRALELQPDLADAHNGLGKSLHATGDREGAIACFRRAVALLPEYAQAASNLGQTLAECGQYEEAMKWSRRAIDIQPEFAPAHWNLSLMLLRTGRWREGWPEFEWRFRTGKVAVNYPQARWDGGELNDRRILLHAEQGLGDTIQFIRYVPMVIQRGGEIVVAAQRELIPLLKTMSGVQQWVSPGDPMPEFAVQCALPSLPGIFKTSTGDLPADVPYLSADRERTGRWSRRMETYAGRRVGLAWTGNPMNPDDRNRSFSPAVLAPLAEIKNLSFFSLQKGEGSAQARQAPMALTDWTSELNDLADTAALIENLDLVITADTVVAHLAGAMGKPVWILLPQAPDWRWLIDRADSPWYPTARLFRQQARGDWTLPVQQAAQALAGL